VHDGPGIRTTVFFKGCPLSCWWCHNPESQDFKSEKSIRNLILSGERFERSETTGKLMSVDEVMFEVLKDQLFYDESGGGVTFSGGEPLMQEMFLLDLLKACKQKGLHTTLDTSGYAPKKVLENIAEHVDLFLYDLKIIDNTLHKKYTGVSNRSILENLKFLYRTGKNVIIRFPVIPGITDTTENINNMKEFITNHQIPTSSNFQIPTSSNLQIPTSSNLQIPTSSNFQISKFSNFQISLLPYHSMAREKYRRFSKINKLKDLPDLKKDELLPLKREFESIGGKVSLGG
jgi:pyruvate formate lyase activating enzyme